LDGAECGVVGDGAAQGFGGGVVVHAGHEPGGVVVGEGAFGLSGGARRPGMLPPVSEPISYVYANCRVMPKLGKRVRFLPLSYGLEVIH
jgi:hypothetical protein